MTAQSPTLPTAASKSRLALLGLAIAGGWTPIAIAAGQSVALRMDEITPDATATYSIIIAAGWAIQMVALPTFGRLFDKVEQRGSSERLLLIVALLASIATAALLANATSTAALATGWLLAQLPAALIITMSGTRLAQETSDLHRGWSSAIAGIAFSLSLLIGAVTTLATSSQSSWLFLAPAIVGATLILPSIAIAPSPVESVTRVTPSSPHTKSARPWRILIVIAIAFSGIAVGRIYAVPLIESVAEDLTPTQLTSATSLAVLAATLAAIIGNTIVGRLVRAHGRSQKILIVTCLFAAVPMIGLALAHSVGQVTALAALLGFVVGMLTSAIYAIYLAQYGHEAHAGQNFGLVVAAETVPYVVVPLIAAATQATIGASILPTLFIAGAALAIISGLLARTLQNSRAI